MSFLFKSKAQDAITDYGRELKDKVGSSNYPRKAKIENGNRGRFTIYFPDGKFVDKFFASYEEANKWCVSNGISVSDECEVAQDGNPTKFVGICYNGANYFVTATSVEQARKELEEKAKKDGRTIQSVRVAEDAAAFKIGDRVKLKGGKRTGKIVGIGNYKDANGEMLFRNDYSVRWDSYPFDVPVKPENLVAADSACDSGEHFKVGEKILVDPSYASNVNIGYGNNVGIVKKISYGDIEVDFKNHGVIRVPVSYCTPLNAPSKSVLDGQAQDYDPNPKTRGKDIEKFVAQAARNEEMAEGLLEKATQAVELLSIRIHSPMKDWEEVMEDCELSPELPQAKKWKDTANRRYDYLLERARAISNILTELHRNHIR